MTQRDKEVRAMMYRNLQNLGFSFEDCNKLRRISQTLRRWYDLECGTENDYGTSFAIERGMMQNGKFVCNPDGKPFMRMARNTSQGYKVTHYATADRETGAIRRLNAIVAPFKRKLAYYLQTDPRGAALYIIPFARLRRYGEKLAKVDCCYSQVGICVY